MENFLSSAGGQIFALICVAFAAGVIAFLAFQRLYLGDLSGWFWVFLAAMMCFLTFTAATRLRKLIP